MVILDWDSRYVPARRLSNTLESDFCTDALNEALNRGTPEIFNTDQISQFTSEEFTGILEKHEIKISMDGKGRYADNLFIERLWRTVKYKEVYLKAYQDARDARIQLREYFDFYNNRRPHQALGYKTPAEVYLSDQVEMTEAGIIESVKPSKQTFYLARIAAPYFNLK